MTDATAATENVETADAGSMFNFDLNSIDQQVIIDFAMNDGLAILGAVAGALAIFIIGRMIVGMVKRGIRKGMSKANVDDTLADFLCNVLGGIGLAFVIIAALSQLGVETTSLAAIFAAAGLAIGLSMQDSLGNLAAGVMMITFRPFKAGDYVEAGGVSGSVKSVDIFTTTLTSPDNKVIIVPNGQIISAPITNYSAQKQRRIDFVFGIGYGDDIKKAKDVLTDIVTSDKRVLKSPAPTVAVLELADSSVNFAVRPWVKTKDYWDVYFAITEEVKLRFDAEGISIPFPQTEITLVKDDAAAAPVAKKPAAKKAAAKSKSAPKKTVATSSDGAEDGEAA